MDTASSNPIEPPPLLFNTPPPQHNPNSSLNQSQPDPSSPHTSSPSNTNTNSFVVPHSPLHHQPPPPSSEPPSAEMDLSTSGILPPPDRPNSDHHMQDPETADGRPDQVSRNGDVHEHLAETMDTTPDVGSVAAVAGLPIDPATVHTREAAITTSDNSTTTTSQTRPDGLPPAAATDGTHGDDDDAMDTSGGVEIPSDGAGRPPPPPTGTDDRPPTLRRSSDHGVGEVADVQASTRQFGSESESTSDSEDDDGPERLEFEEDRSGPTEDELKEIEARGERSAHDEHFFIKKFFKPLDDPEYIPGEAGRINWTVENVRGTWSNRNKKAVLRSDPVRIGGLDWNMKFYPKGNGTSHISIYLECAKPGTGPKRKKTSHKPSPVVEKGRQMDEESGAGTSSTSAASRSNQDGETRPVATNDTQANTQANDNESEDENEYDDDSSESETESQNSKRFKSMDHSWGTAAQFGVVMYNPNEPRTNFYHGNHHLFCAVAPDWGWTRFHGPNDSIHKRRHGYRSALLRDDKLSFTAYIRLVKDDTKSLWDHSAKDGEWNSLAKTGLRAINCEGDGRAYVIAAISSWVLLRPVRELLYNFAAKPWPSFARMPLLRSLIAFLHNLQTQKSPPSNAVGVHFVLYDLEATYGLKLSDKLEVVEFWEILRRKVEHELQGTEYESALADMFDVGIVAAESDKFSGIVPGGHALKSGKEIRVPGLRITANRYTSLQRCFKKRRGGENEYIPQLSSLPKVLHIELERQYFDEVDRRWKRDDTHVTLDEELDVASHAPGQSCTKYALYGFITHEGDLRSGKYNSVLRPGGPQTKWFRYASDSHGNKVEALTQKKALGLNGYKSKASVAYIALYVRMDVLGEVLSGLPDEPEAPSWAKDGNLHNLFYEAVARKVELEGHPPKVPVGDKKYFDGQWTITVVESTILNGWTGRGYPSETLNMHLFEDKPEVHKLLMSNPQTVADVKSELVKTNEDITDPAQCQLWVTAHGCPYTLAIDTDDIGTLIDKCAGLLWFRKIPLVKPTPAVSQVSEAAASTSNAAEGSRINEVGDIIHIPSLPSSEVAAPTTSAAEGMDIDTTISPQLQAAVTPTSMSAEAREYRDRLVSALRNSAEEESLGNDIDNNDTTNPAPLTLPTMLDPGLPALPAPVSPFGVATPPPPPMATRSVVYLLFKRFDPQNQTLTGVGDLECKLEDKLDATVRKEYSIPADQELTFWYEFQGACRQLSGSQTFEYHELTEGCVIIFQNKCTEKETRDLEAAALAPTAPAYVTYLLSTTNFPDLLDGPYSHSYFSSVSFSGPLKNALPHGPSCHATSQSGDSYTGPYISNQRHGPHGTMTFANGDIYTGAWADGFMEGQGKLVYKKTGNVYEGGFRGDRRHGRGVMQFQVADEEENVCQICYESEMNAVFNDCGHLCACLGCARQVDVCPVCRKAVMSVIRLYKS